MNKPTNIDEYIAQSPEATQSVLQEIRMFIRGLVPDATEAISYGIPTWVLNGNLVHIAAYERHIGFYPAPSGLQAFEADLAGYKKGKGSVQFPLDRPIPWALIERIVQWRKAEQLAKKARKTRK
ncbi:MAG TPA: DUF1801 domain-containing protein [Rhodothermales bacterium]|nr:hypothetical protein [Bacteroidota bacterium]HRK73241.1 DUF1801 domain-containing protein [Rhodothermales bacterium]HRR08356.1 DUF1801 domain-containing protein [Rhodothermales bacterium]